MNNAGNSVRGVWFGRDRAAWACYFSILRLFRGPEDRELSDPIAPKKCALWTWTFPDGPCAFDIKEASAAWRAMGKSGAFFATQRRFVRVFELAPKTGRCHVHAVTDEFWRVEEVRETAQRFGFGRVHVCLIPVEEAGYVAKYLGKRHGFRKGTGVRWWAASGFDHCLTRDVRRTEKVRVVVADFADRPPRGLPPTGYVPGEILTPPPEFPNSVAP